MEINNNFNRRIDNIIILLYFIIIIIRIKLFINNKNKFKN